MNKKSDIPFAQEGLGEILLIMGETCQKANNWLYSNKVDTQQGVRDIGSRVGIDYGVSGSPPLGVPCLGIKYYIAVHFQEFDRIWWQIHNNFYLDGRQFTTSSFRREIMKIDHYGPEVISTIYTGKVPIGQAGIQMMQEVCQLTYQHMVDTLTKQTASEIYSSYLNQHEA